MAKPSAPKQGGQDSTASSDTYAAAPSPAISAEPAVAAERARASGAARAPATAQTATAQATSKDESSPASGSPAASTQSGGETRVVERRGGFFPMLLGGVLAAGAGFALSEYLGPTFLNGQRGFETEARDALEAQQGNLDALSSRIEGIETGLGSVDLTSVETAIADLVARTGTLGERLTAIETALTGVQGETGARLEEIGAALAEIEGGASGFSDRLAALEKRPMEDAVSPETIAAYEQEMENLRQSLADQMAEIEAQRQEVAALAERATDAERAAEEKAALAEQRAAAAGLVSAVASGAPYADALAGLSGGDIPESLSAPAETGVATVAELTEDWPAAARDALAAARAEGQSGAAGGLTGFLTTQLGMRSVTPREGDDADAILSRADAAVKTGDLDTALAEISTLPEAAQAALSDWTQRARTRVDAVAAAEGLVQNLNQE